MRGVSSLAWPLPFTQEPLPRCWCQVLGVGVCEALARCPAPAVSGRSIRHLPLPVPPERRGWGVGVRRYRLGARGEEDLAGGDPGGPGTLPGPKGFPEGGTARPAATTGMDAPSPSQVASGRPNLPGIQD